MISPLIMALALYTDVSLPDESLDEFILRAGYTISKQTDKRNAEICAVIIKDGGRYRIDVSTNDRLTSCDVPNGNFVTVHSHPRLATPAFSPSDYLTPGYLVHGRNVYHQAGKGTERFVGRVSKSSRVENQESSVIADDGYQE